MDALTIDASNLSLLVLIGLAAGMVGGLIGVGGSIVMIPAMTELLGARQHLYQSAAMIVNFFVVVPAVLQHLRAGAVMGHIVGRMVPLAVTGVGAGVLLSELPTFRGPGQAYLMILFGVLVLFAAVRNSMQLFGAAAQEQEPSLSAGERIGWKAGLVAGFPTGLVAGLLGVGGGIVAVPVQNKILGLPLRNAIANSAATIVALSLVGAVGKNYALTVNHPEHSLDQSLWLAAALIPSAILGSLVGARLTHVLPVRVVRGVLVLFLFAAAVRMASRGLTTIL